VIIMISKPPTRGDVLKTLESLVNGKLNQEDAADWANKWRKMDDGVYGPIFDDKVIWRALELLEGADLKDSPSSYLHVKEDFIAWLEEIKKLCNEDT